MTEIDVTRIGKWWNSVSRFLESGLGVLVIAVGVIQLLRNEESAWGGVLIGAGTTIAIIPLTAVKCSTCGSPNPFEQVWKTVYKHQQFTCYACGTRYRLPLWNRVILNSIIYGYGFLSLVSACNEFVFNSWINAPDYWSILRAFPLPWALALLVVRFSPYERLDSA